MLSMYGHCTDYVQRTVGRTPRLPPDLQYVYGLQSVYESNVVRTERTKRSTEVLSYYTDVRNERSTKVLSYFISYYMYT